MPAALRTASDRDGSLSCGAMTSFLSSSFYCVFFAEPSSTARVRLGSSAILARAWCDRVGISCGLLLQLYRALASSCSRIRTPGGHYRGIETARSTGVREERPPPSNHALPSIRPGGRSSGFRQLTVGAHPGLTGARDQHTSPEFHIGASFYPDIRPPPWTASTEPLPSVRTFLARSPFPLHRVAPSNLGFELCVLGVRARRESAAVRTG